MLKSAEESSAILTKKNEFKLALPRVYFCSMKLYMRSDNHFNVRLEMIDQIDEERAMMSEKETTYVKSSESAQLKKVFQENNVHTYLSGDLFPIKGKLFNTDWQTFILRMNINSLFWVTLFNQKICLIFILTILILFTHIILNFRGETVCFRRLFREY